MKTNSELIKARQYANRAQLKLAREREKERKLDTHIKIQLGGLIVKSQMSGYSKAVILGALTDAFNNIQNDPDYERIYKLKGENAFLKDE
jgi:hypothetical protein